LPEPGALAVAGERLLVVANPHASRSASGLAPALDVLVRAGFDIDLRQTRDRDGLDRLIRTEGPAAAAVVIAGGDGTVNGAIAALIDCRRPAGILPLGTANDLALTLGIPADPVAAASVIAAGRRRRIDVGCVNRVHFLNVASIGLAVAVAARQDPELKRRWRTLSYVVASVAALGEAERFAAVIDCDGRVERVEAFQIAVGNGVRYGGGLVIAEDAAIDDGLLDICVLATRTVADLIAAAPGLLDGRVGRRDDVIALRGRQIRIRTQSPMPVNTDGELTTETPAEFAVLAEALDVFVPEPPADAAA